MPRKAVLTPRARGDLAGAELMRERGGRLAQATLSAHAKPYPVEPRPRAPLLATRTCAPPSQSPLRDAAVDIASYSCECPVRVPYARQPFLRASAAVIAVVAVASPLRGTPLATFRHVSPRHRGDIPGALAAATALAMVAAAAAGVAVFVILVHPEGDTIVPSSQRRVSRIVTPGTVRTEV